MTSKFFFVLLLLALASPAAFAAEVTAACQSEIASLKKSYAENLELARQAHRVHQATHQSIFAAVAHLARRPGISLEDLALMRKAPNNDPIPARGADCASTPATTSTTRSHRISRSRLKNEALIRMALYHDLTSPGSADCVSDPMDSPDYFYMQCRTNNDPWAPSENTITARIDEGPGTLTLCSETVLVQPIRFGGARSLLQDEGWQPLTRVSTQSCTTYDLARKTEITPDIYYRAFDTKIELMGIREAINIPPSGRWRQPNVYDTYAHTKLYWDFAGCQLPGRAANRGDMPMGAHDMPCTENYFLAVALHQLDWNCGIATHHY
ncbi:MAG: hypothetical protein HY074_08230 [Deltaproteobacteria bacterium]|nr:hypothetical protein [Deltaproteobacteria bacterium]